MTIHLMDAGHFYVQLLPVVYSQVRILEFKLNLSFSTQVYLAVFKRTSPSVTFSLMKVFGYEHLPRTPIVSSYSDSLWHLDSFIPSHAGNARRSDYENYVQAELQRGGDGDAAPSAWA